MKAIISISIAFLCVLFGLSIANYYNKFNSVLVSIHDEIALDIVAGQNLSIRKKLVMLSDLGFKNIRISYENDNSELQKSGSIGLLPIFSQRIMVDGQLLAVVSDQPSLSVLIDFLFVNKYVFILCLSFYVMLLLFLLAPLLRYKYEVQSFISSYSLKGRTATKSKSDSVIRSIQTIIDSNTEKALELQQIKVEKERQESISRLANKLAHDIRSPISTLNLMSSKITDPEIRNIQLAVVEQINSISNGLLNEVRGINNDLVNEALTLKSIANLFEVLSTEYSIKSISLKRQISFTCNEVEVLRQKISQELYSILYSCLNNFIQNSIEATNDGARISVTVFSDYDMNSVIRVKDNGDGIPKSILNQLGAKHISYGKNHNQFNSGSGIAIFNAKKDLEQHGAELIIESKESEYTEVSIILRT